MEFLQDTLGDEKSHNVPTNTFGWSYFSLERKILNFCKESWMYGKSWHIFFKLQHEERTWERTKNNVIEW